MFVATIVSGPTREASASNRACLTRSSSKTASTTRAAPRTASARSVVNTIRPSTVSRVAARELLPLDRPGEHLLDQTAAAVDRGLVDVTDPYREPGLGAGLGDAAAHVAPAQDGHDQPEVRGAAPTSEFAGERSFPRRREGVGPALNRSPSRPRSDARAGLLYATPLARKA